MTKRIKRQIYNPGSRAEAERIVSQIRDLKIDEMAVQAEREADLKKIDEKFAPRLDSIATLIENKVASVQAWAEANPGEFGKRKSIETVHGTFGFRTGTPKLALLSRAWNWAKALAEVQALLPAFVRSVPEIDKEALIAQRDEDVMKYALPRCGLKVVQDESFFVEPNVSEVEVKETAKAA